MATPITYQEATTFNLNRFAEVGRCEDPAIEVANYKAFLRNYWGNPSNFEERYSFHIWLMSLEFALEG